MNRTAKVIMVAAAFFIGTASVVFAEGNTGSDIAPGKIYSCLNQRGMGKFRGGIQMLPPAGALSKEQMDKLETLRTEFRSATRDLRQELRSKRLALKSELVKKEPDAKAARTLQKDISALNSELGQKRIEHVLEMKKIAPYGSMARQRDGRERPRGGCIRQM